MLYIIATPIGNLKDITLRSLEILKEVDGVICEDTRRTKILLDHFEIHKPLFTLNDFNESKMFPIIIENLQLGKKLALVSDAGTPLVSDPGYKLIRECITEGIEVDSLPGPTAPITALTLSGFPPDKFMFLGYLPEKPGQRANMLENLKRVFELQPTTFIAFVAPHKVIKTLEGMKETYGEIEICLAKELTKMHQKIDTKKPSDWLEQFKKNPPRGEYVMLFRPDNSQT
jgi:16S rRNA (cytidine1402-2'-O)-methyltransferase